MKKYVCLFLVSLIPILISAQPQEKTAFQTADRWMPEIDLRSDVAMVYGVNSSFLERVKGWRDHGYGIHFMTGVAWGEYRDYLQGRFDGKNHMDEGQVARDGNVIWHHPGVPYMVPSETYVEYMKSLIKQAIDAGATAIHLEEPEFWARGGYSEGFKREWQQYYGEPWLAQHESPDAAYRSAKLKYHLYFRALKDIFLYAKEYSEKQGARVRCFVPTHTLINYSTWQIVSPESSLADLPGMDGYIAQVWTGTARTPVIYNGIEKERTFENAYLEYASMVAMTAPTGRRVYFLTDPVEDNPDHTWEDYKRNYEATFTAQLMFPSVSHYEVMPWPSRIFMGRYQVEGATERQKIPPRYASEILILINALNDMEQSETVFPGPQGIGVLVSDTMMFQRFPPHGSEDHRLSNFYGMALPLLKQGIPMQLVQLENLLFPETLKNLRVLLMSYAHMKPLKPEYHQTLAQWVKNGGALLYFGKDDDPYQSVREWWNQEDKKYQAPSEHLFQQMEVADVSNVSGTFRYGKGLLSVIRENPKNLAMASDGGAKVREKVLSALNELGEKTIGQEKNSLHLQRGPYDIIAVLDESVNDQPLSVSGPIGDLFDPDLPVLSSKIVKPGERAFLLSLKRLKKSPPLLLASASRIVEEKSETQYYSFTLKGPAETEGIALLLLPDKPALTQGLLPNGTEIPLFPEWDGNTKTLRIRYPNNPEGVRVKITFPESEK